MANTGQERVVLRTYVEDDLAAWVQGMAAGDGRTTSAWLRFVLHRLRAEFTSDPSALAATLTAGGTHDAT